MTVENFLDNKHIRYEAHDHDKTYTAQALAQAEHVSGYAVAKPVIVKSDGEFVMCVVQGPRHVDLKRVAGVLHKPSVELASEPEMQGLFPDCEIGAEPPIGTMFNMKTIADVSLRQGATIVMQAGRHTRSIKMRRTDWESVCNPRVAPIAAD